MYASGSEHISSAVLRKPLITSTGLCPLTGLKADLGQQKSGLCLSLSDSRCGRSTRVEGSAWLAAHQWTFGRERCDNIAGT